MALRVFELLNLHETDITYTIRRGSVIECLSFNTNKVATECPSDEILQAPVVMFEACGKDRIMIHIAANNDNMTLAQRCIQEYKDYSNNMSAMASAGYWLQAHPDNTIAEYEQALIDSGEYDEGDVPEGFYGKVHQLIEDAVFADLETEMGPPDDDPDLRLVENSHFTKIDVEDFIEVATDYAEGILTEEDYLDDVQFIALRARTRANMEMKKDSDPYFSAGSWVHNDHDKLKVLATVDPMTLAVA